ncbi:MAG: polysaccharide deacetylase, partial [Bacteroidia bacterium]
KMTKEERETRKGLFGSWKDGFRPNKAYNWQYEGKSLLEIPVTTMPIFKVPIHASYVLFLGTYSQALAMAYVRFTVMMCKLTGTRPSILLHPLDFIGYDDTEALSFFPAMRIQSKPKIELMGKMFDYLAKHFELVPMKTHAEFEQQRKSMPTKELSLA